MKKLTIRKKKWLLSKSRKAIRKLQRENNRRTYCDNVSKRKNKHSGKRYDVTAPEHLSLFGNMKDTISYFSAVQDQIEKCGLDDTIFFDLAHVKKVSADAIMYLIALIKNTKKIRRNRIRCVGNEPNDPTARAKINRVGFFRHVSSPNFHKAVDGNNQIQISRGTLIDNDLAAKVCDFVCENTKGKRDRIGTKKLFPMLIELMTNTHQHAYSTKRHTLNCNWFMYVENTKHLIRFIFLDTGEGIPNTIRQSIIERVIGLVRPSDAQLIASTLQGKFRTETGQKYRGKGLPEIYNNVQSHAFCSLKLLSSKGFCEVHHNGEISETELEKGIDGTFFLWCLKK